MTDEGRGLPRALDLFCCQGGQSFGLFLAGCQVTGVDKDPQPRYPFTFLRANVLDLDPDWIAASFDLVTASPPCQRYTACQRIRGNEHPDLIGPTRALLEATGLPYWIENVEEARSELRDPVLLCGRSFPGLSVYRHRLFESNVALRVPEHPEHDKPLRKMGRPPLPGDFMHVVGNFSGVAQAREAMGGVDWMNRDGLRESIPPAYAEYLAAQMLAAMTPARVSSS